MVAIFTLRLLKLLTQNILKALEATAIIFIEPTQ